MREVVVAGAGGALVELGRRGAGPTATLSFPCGPDHRLARRCAAGLRRLVWVLITVDGDGGDVRCRLLAIRRHPVEQAVPLAAALAFAASGVPTVVTSQERP